MGAVSIALGRIKQAVFYVEQEIEIAKKCGNKRTYANGLNSLGEIMRTRGDGKKAINYFNEALTNIREVANKSSEIMIMSKTGGAMILAGDYEKAANHLQNVIETFGDSNHFIISETFLFLAQARLGQDKNIEALAAAKRSFELSEKSEEQEIMGQAWHVPGLISVNLEQKITLKKDSFDDRQGFENSLRIFSEIKSEAPRARTLRSFAAYENKVGNSQTAHKIINEAREIFTRLEMFIELERSFLI